MDMGPYLLTQLNPTQQRMYPTQPNPTHGLTQPMFISESDLSVPYTDTFLRLIEQR